MPQSASVLPHWDMSVVYPGIDSPEFERGWQAAVGALDGLMALCDRHGVGRHDPAPLDDATLRAFEEVLERTNVVMEELRTLRAYIWGFVSTDTRNERAQAAWSEFRQQTVRLKLLDARLTAWIGSFDVEALIERSALAREHAFLLRKEQQRAAHLMSPDEEALAAELSVVGSGAWTNLYRTFTSQMLIPLELEGKTQELPISALRALAYDRDRDVRRRAYEAELAAWRGAAVPIAAALNGVKGEQNTLSARRNWASPLDAALFDNHIDRPTLEAMMAAARESFPAFRRYMRAKARALGMPALAWYDLFAPLEPAGREWSFDEAASFIVEQFGAYSPRLQQMAERAFRERWIDAEPRPGKVDGAFCMGLRGDESRILANYKPAFGQMTILAHELGHAYHNLNLAHRTILQRSTPMTLAETASTFCEMFVEQAALRQIAPQEQIPILDVFLQDACQVVVDITSRFLFEQAVYERRRQRELSIEELNEIMLDAQRQTYGDGLDPATYHPYRWAARPHYYSSSFYNFPYMFGLLFGLGLYARYLDDPEGFKAGYDDLLASTGMGEAAELAARFGIDIRSTAFWRSSLDVIRADIDRFEALVDRQDTAMRPENSSPGSASS